MSESSKCCDGKTRIRHKAVAVRFAASGVRSYSFMEEIFGL